MEVQVLDRQCLPDIAIQEGGSLECIFDLAETNGIKITEKLEKGSVMQYTQVAYKQIANYFKVNDIHPATDYEKDIVPEGIGYWLIGLDFIIS